MRKKSDKQRRGGVAAAEVFRQFAWHLAGSLAGGKVAPPRPPKNAASR